MWWLIIAHFIGDWGLQNRWMAENKSKYWEVLLAHCFIYTGIVSIALQYLNIFTIWKVIFLLITHFVTDNWSSNRHKSLKTDKEIRTNLHIDHLLHFAQLIIVYFI